MPDPHRQASTSTSHTHPPIPAIDISEPHSPGPYTLNPHAHHRTNDRTTPTPRPQGTGDTSSTDDSRSSDETKPVYAAPFGSSTTFAAPDDGHGHGIENRYKKAMHEAEEEIYEMKHGAFGGQGKYAHAGERAAALAEEDEEDKERERKKEKDRKGANTPDGAKTDGTLSDATAESDFDWDSGSDTDDEEEAKKGMKEGNEDEEENVQRKKVARAKRLRKVYLGCLRLSRPVRTLLIALCGGGILIIPAVVLWTHFNGVNRGVRANVLLWSIWLTIVWVAACFTSIFVDLLPALIFRVTYLIVGRAPEMLKTHTEILMATAFWSKLFLDIVWAWVSLGGLCQYTLFKEARADDLDYFDAIFNVIQALFGSALVLLIEKYLLQGIAFNFHQTAVKDRLEENGRALWALDKLAAAKERRPRTRLRGSTYGIGGHATGQSSSHGHGHGHGHGHHGGSGNILSAIHSAFGSRAPSPTHSRPPSPKHGMSLATAAQKVHKQHRESLGQNQVESEKKEEELTPEMREKAKRAARRAQREARKRADKNKTWGEQLSDALAAATLKPAKSRRAAASSLSARRLARKLFEGLGGRRNYLEVDDFYPYFDKEDDAKLAFAIFDKDGNGDISKKEMREAVQRIYKERRALSASLKDMSSAVSKLDMVLLFLALLIMVFIWLLVFNPSETIASFVPLATIILGLSFVFGNSAKNVFESMIFVFQVHPYDVGDLVFIDDQPLVVKEFGMLSTTFCRVDGQVITAPNPILSTEKFILNVRRSGSMWETTNIMVGFETPLEALDDLRSKLRNYVQENNREWKGGLDLNVESMTHQNMITLIVAMEHKGNWQDWGARWDRRTKLMRAMKTFMDELQITYRLPMQPISFHPTGGAPFRPGANRSGSSDGGGPRSPQISSPLRRQASLQPGRAHDLGNAGHLSPQPRMGARQGDFPPLRVDTRQTFRPTRGDMDGGGLGG